MTDFTYHGAEEGWTHPCVGDLVQYVPPRTAAPRVMGVVIEPDESIRRDEKWCQIAMSEGGTRIVPKRDVIVLNRAGE